MRTVAASFVVVLLLVHSSAAVDRAPDPGLQIGSAAMQRLIRTIGRSVVQVVVTGFQASADSGSPPVLVHSRSIASGVAIASGGLIVTNEHVVSGAERIEVVLPDEDDTPLGHHTGRSVAAQLIGVAPEIDLALLHVDVALPALPLADAKSVHQGDLVFAFGSPEGLRNSVSMGLVSAVARQLEPNSPIAYVQTDAAINPGNSGGPLVNVHGEVVGINTFIHTQSGGSEGLGFALPAQIVAVAVPVLRKCGHLRPALMGLETQDVTPALKEGLALPDDALLVVSDVLSGSAAADAGLRSGDAIVSFDDTPLASVSYVDLYRYLYALDDGQRVKIGYVRGNERATAVVAARTAPHTCGAPEMLDHVEDDIVEPLGIIATPVSDDDRRGGIVITARIGEVSAIDTPLAVGDIIRSINREPITSATALRDAIRRVPHGHGIVLQVERGGNRRFVSFER